MLEPDAITIADGGDILSFARMGLPPRTYLDSGAFGCLGVGIPYGVAAALLHPDRQVVVITGDGAFGINAMEIDSAKRHGAKVVFIVANNAAWNIERLDQEMNYGGRVVGTTLQWSDYAAMARAFGLHGERVTDPARLDGALAEAFANAPALLDVVVTQRRAVLRCRQGLGLGADLSGADRVGRAPSAHGATCSSAAAAMSALLTVAEVVAAQARLQPAKIGARDSRRALTFAQLERACEPARQRACRHSGLAKGDRVAILAYNCVEWMEIYVGARCAPGLVAVPINFRLVAPEIAYIAQHCEARAFIVQDELVDRVEPIRAELGIVAGGFIHFGAARAPAGWQSYEALIERAAAAMPDVRVAPEDTWALMYTSGTTGRPKGAIRNHAGSALISLVTALDMGFARDDTGLLVMPMCHANSLYFSFTFTYLGATCVIDDRKSFDPEQLLRDAGERE